MKSIPILVAHSEALPFEALQPITAPYLPNRGKLRCCRQLNKGLQLMKMLHMACHLTASQHGRVRNSCSL
ncbi:hypothetical protein PsorP6_015325 [Peronosclerospora sorghi]|uniref:Uncharacterized protein n=1 Tax=Peronosclerospora sorghi TaxID=230839 RepID=A0ACC0VT52_9STRA|nr:hypothetical protein PsorP6_015325 [Peronosclerospora sorghi]